MGPAGLKNRIDFCRCRLAGRNRIILVWYQFVGELIEIDKSADQLEALLGWRFGCGVIPIAL